MSKAEDITNLFRRFGGDAGTYQEIVEHDQAEAAQRAWPMLGHIQPQQHQEAPAARANAVLGAVRQRQADEPLRTVVMKPPLHVAPLAAVVRPHAEVKAPSDSVVPSPVVSSSSVAKTPVEVPQLGASAAAAVPTFAPPPASMPEEVVTPPVATTPVTTSGSPVTPAVVPVAPVRFSAPGSEPPVTPNAVMVRTELTDMFDRMAKAALRSTQADQASSPLKRLVKW